MLNKNHKKENKKDKDVLTKLDFEQPFKFKEEWLPILKEQFWKARGSSDGAPPPEPLNDPYRLDPFLVFIADIEPSIGGTLLLLRELKKRPLKSEEKDVIEKLKRTSTKLISQLNELHPFTAKQLEAPYWYGYNRKPLISEVNRLVQVLDKMLHPVTNKRGRPSSDWIFLVEIIASIMISHELKPTLRAGYLGYILDAVMDTLDMPGQSVETMMEKAWPLIKQSIEHDKLDPNP